MFRYLYEIVYIHRYEYVYIYKFLCLLRVDNGFRVAFVGEEIKFSYVPIGLLNYDVVGVVVYAPFFLSLRQY